MKIFQPCHPLWRIGERIMLYATMPRITTAAMMANNLTIFPISYLPLFGVNVSLEQAFVGLGLYSPVHWLNRIFLNRLTESIRSGWGVIPQDKNQARNRLRPLGKFRIWAFKRYLRLIGWLLKSNPGQQLVTLRVTINRPLAKNPKKSPSWGEKRLSSK
jgi:cytochrome b561